jgi:hypothetical protein
MKLTSFLIRTVFIIAILSPLNSYSRGEPAGMDAGISAGAVQVNNRGLEPGFGEWSKGAPLTEILIPSEETAPLPGTEFDGDQGANTENNSLPMILFEVDAMADSFLINYAATRIQPGLNYINYAATLQSPTATPEEKRDAVTGLSIIANMPTVNRVFRNNALTTLIDASHRDTLGEEVYQYAIAELNALSYSFTINDQLRETAVSTLLDEAVNENTDLERKGDLLNLISKNVWLAGDDTSLKTRAGIYLNNYGILIEHNQESWDTDSFIDYKKSGQLTDEIKTRIDAEFNSLFPDDLELGEIATVL